MTSHVLRVKPPAVEATPDLGFTLSLTTILTDVAQLKEAQSVNGNSVSSPATRTTEDAGIDPLVAGLQVSLPLWYDKYAAGERQAMAEKRAARADEAALLDSLQSNARMVLVKYRDAVRQAKLYESSLTPKATQALEATVDSYQADVASVGDVFEAERTFLELRLAQARALADQAQRLSLLERLVGQPLGVAGKDGDSVLPNTPIPGQVPSLSYTLDAPAPRPVSGNSSSSTK